MTKKHQKHANISRVNTGYFGKNEYAILGTSCGEIKHLAHQVCQNLSDHYSIGYVDADHKSADDPSNMSQSTLAHGYQIAYEDKIDFHRWEQSENIHTFDFNLKFVNQDLILINGNHFEGKKQIVVIDPKKSLEKKLHKLTNVALILFQKEATHELPGYLLSHLPELGNIPQYSISDIEPIITWIRKELKEASPPINGLVLAGGQSTRMQRDKSLIEYFGKSQKTHMYELLKAVTTQVFYSIRPSQTENVQKDEIVDTFTGLGPYGAILSAFRMNPNVAWLVTACDQPLVTREVLELLIANRNPSKVATAFYNPETDFPEPLITLWEPKAYFHLLYFLSLGYSCPRKVLINSEIEIVDLADPIVLKNVNTPEEYEEVIELLRTGNRS